MYLAHAKHLMGIPKALALLFVMLLVVGCSDVIDCIIPEKPKLSTDIPVAFLNEEYRAVLTASVSNNPSDDKFEYGFSFSGELPEGLTYGIIEREFIIKGEPVELGEFPLNVHVHVSDPGYDSSDDEWWEDDDGLCGTTKSRDFSIVVEER